MKTITFAFGSQNLRSEVFSHNLIIKKQLNLGIELLTLCLTTILWARLFSDLKSIYLNTAIRQKNGQTIRLR